MKQVRHHRINAAIIRRRRQNDMAVFKGLADEFRNMGRGNIINRQISDTVLCQHHRQGIGRIFRISIHRCIHNHNPRHLRFITAP